MTITEIKSRHGIIAERKAGGGHMLIFRAYFAHIRSPQGRKVSALAYVTRFGFDAMVAHGHAAEGRSEDEALERLCKANGIKL